MYIVYLLGGDVNGLGLDPRMVLYLSVRRVSFVSANKVTERLVELLALVGYVVVQFEVGKGVMSLPRFLVRHRRMCIANNVAVTHD